jgi:hypothetical protein
MKGKAGYTTSVPRHDDFGDWATPKKPAAELFLCAFNGPLAAWQNLSGRQRPFCFTTLLHSAPPGNPLAC